MITGAVKKSAIRALVFGGILPIVVFTIIEEYYGTMWGLVSGMALGGCELLVEWRRQGRVQAITWIANGLLLGLGCFSLLTAAGIWFKLQPAIMEGILSLIFVGSVLVGHPFLVWLAIKQNLFTGAPQEVHSLLKEEFSRLTVRIGIFFGIHSALATYAAFYWSTRSWALLKGIGFTLSLIIYMLLEVLFMRRRIRSRVKGS